MTVYQDFPDPLNVEEKKKAKKNNRQALDILNEGATYWLQNFNFDTAFVTKKSGHWIPIDDCFSHVLRDTSFSFSCIIIQRILRRYTQAHEPKNKPKI